MGSRLEAVAPRREVLASSMVSPRRSSHSVVLRFQLVFV